MSGRRQGMREASNEIRHQKRCVTRATEKPWRPDDPESSLQSAHWTEIGRVVSHDAVTPLSVGLPFTIRTDHNRRNLRKQPLPDVRDEGSSMQQLQWLLHTAHASRLTAAQDDAGDVRGVDHEYIHEHINRSSWICHASPEGTSPRAARSASGCRSPA